MGKKIAKVSVPLMVLRARHDRISQRHLSELTGLSQRALSFLESGKTKGIDFETVARLCEVFDCSPGDLFEVEFAADDVPQPVAKPKAAPVNGRRKHAGLASGAQPASIAPAGPAKKERGRGGK